MRLAESVSLSKAAPKKPEGDRLTATDCNIEKIDYVKWDSKGIKFVNLQFNNIQYLMGLGQFENLVGLNLSNNNICALSDLRLLSRHQHLEFLDLTNNPITHHDFYREFVTIFVENIKNLDRLAVAKKHVESIRKDSQFIKDLLTTLLVNLLKIISTKAIATRLTVNEELRQAFGTERETDLKRAKMFEMLQRNIIDGFDNEMLIEFEAYILDDLEMLMDKYFPDKAFVEGWGLACAELGTQQIDKLQKDLMTLQLDEQTIKRIAFRSGAMEDYSPGPRDDDNYSPAKSRVSAASRSPQTISRKNSGGKGYPNLNNQYAIEVSASLKEGNRHLRNCLGFHGESGCGSRSPSAGKKYCYDDTRTSVGLTIVEKINTLQKRVIDMEELLKEKLSNIMALGRRGRELEEIQASRYHELAALEDAVRREQSNEDKTLELKRQVQQLQEVEANMENLSNRIQQLEIEKQKLLQKIAELKIRVREHQNRFNFEDQPSEDSQTNNETSNKNLLRKALEGWKQFSIQKAKLALHLKIKKDKQRTRVFTTWKRIYQEQVNDALEVRIQMKAIREERTRAAIRDQDKEEIRQKSLEALKKRLEREPAPRAVPKTKLLRLENEQKATSHYKKQQQSWLESVFEAWKESSIPFRKEKRTKREQERRQVVRKVFNGFKLFTDQLKKVRSIAIERKAVRIQTLKRKVFRALNLGKSILEENKQRIQTVAAGNRGKIFKAWKQISAERQESKQTERFLRSRLVKIRKEAFFRMLKEGISAQKRHRLAFQKILEARERVLKRRKLNQFKLSTIVSSKLLRHMKAKKLNENRELFEALKIHSQLNRRLKSGLLQLMTIETSWRSRFKEEFYRGFAVMTLRQINKEKAIMDFIGRRKTRIGAGFFEIIMNEWIRSKKVKLAAFNIKLEELNKFKNTSSERCIQIDQSYTELIDSKRNLEEKVLQIEESITQYENQATLESSCLDALEVKRASIKQDLTDKENLLFEREVKLQGLVRVELESIADLSTGANTASEDCKILQECLKSRKDKLFEVREKKKASTRELDLVQSEHKRRVKDLVQHKTKGSSHLIELQSKSESINEALNELDTEIEMLKNSIKELEADTEADERLAEEINTTGDLTQARCDVRSLAIDMESKKDYNAIAETEIGISKVWEGTEHDTNRVLTSSAKPDYLSWKKGKTLDISQGEFKSAVLLKSSYRRSPSPPITERSRNMHKPSDFGGRSTKDNDPNNSYASNGNEQSFGFFNPPRDPETGNTDNLLLGMQEDLRMMRIRRAGMVTDLKDKIKNIEAELNHSAYI